MTFAFKKYKCIIFHEDLVRIQQQKECGEPPQQETLLEKKNCLGLNKIEAKRTTLLHFHMFQLLSYYI